MSFTPIRLNSICLIGPDKEPAFVKFGPGLNVIRGASDTGKSFIVAAIDYMLGARDPLKKITESEGYNRVVLSLYSAAKKEHYTLVRGTQGGNFEVFFGNHLERPTGEPSQVLKVATNATPNVSAFLLDLVGLSGQWVMKNKDGDTDKLGFRNLTPLCVVNETQIQSETPPALSEQVVLQTKSKQVFKLLLTGIDDSGIVSKKDSKASKAKSNAQIELIDELIAEFQQAISQDGRSQEDLKDQADKLEPAINKLRAAIGVTEEAFSRMRQRRFDLRRKSEANDVRQGEITSLLARLEFLDEHYLSDLQRLEAIAEAGVIYHASEATQCPICGADAEHQKHHAQGEKAAESAANAADAEIEKINILRTELKLTVQALGGELTQLQGELPLISNELADIEIQYKEQMPQHQEEQRKYAELLELRSSIHFALERFNQVAKLNERKEGLAPEDDDQEGNPTNLIDPGLSEQTLFAFSGTVESILKDWTYPEPRTVSVREKDLELIVGGKPRSSSGKGVRALLHSAFTLGLLNYVRTNALSHPGFVVLDSPLLTYAPPEKNEKKSADDEAVALSNLSDRFLECLRDWPNDTQVLIVENVPMPEWVTQRSTTTVFTRNEQHGRYGFIPRRKS